MALKKELTKETVKEVKEEIKTEPTVDIQALIAQAVALALAEKDKEIEKLKNETKVENNVVKTASSYKIIPSDTKVRLKSNINGKFIWSEDRGKTRVFIEVDDAGQEFVLDYDEYQIVAKKNFLKKAMLAITDVYSSDDNVTIFDVAKDQNVGYLYEGNIQANNLELLFKDEVTIDEFSAFVNKNKDVADTVLDVAYKLYRQGSFTNSFKMDFLKAGFGNYNLFK